LIIDDDSIQLQLTKDMLLSLTSSEKNVIRTIVCCQHPEEVFERINEEEFDIIFTDIQMPAMDGFHLLEAIRNIPCKQAQDIPVVAITARAIPDDEGFRARGFAAVLRKPFSRKDIINAIGFALNKTSTDITEFNADKNDIVITTCNENKTISEESSVTSSEFNFSRLTEFSMDDVEAARCILTTFADETRKNITKMDDAISRNDIKEICAIAHKMLPTFIMIEAREAIPSLQWLDEHKEKSTDSETALTHAHIIIKTAINAIRVIDDNAS
jgi:CheY-like chemotaxis protein